MRMTNRDSDQLTVDLLGSKPKPAEVITLPNDMNNHDHDYTQVVIGLAGLSEFEINGSGNYIKPGQGCIVTASQYHSFGGVTVDSNILVLNLPSLDDDSPILLSKLSYLAQADTYFQLDNQIQQLIKLLVMEMESNPDDLLLSRACNDTVIALLQRHTKAFQTRHKENRIDMDVIDRYIDHHLNRTISIAQLAGSVYLAESHFHLLFKEQNRITPHQYLLIKRIEFAKALIEQGKLSLNHIADLSGFSSQSSFTHAFTRLQGVTPSQYKKYTRPTLS